MYTLLLSDVIDSTSSATSLARRSNKYPKGLHTKNRVVPMRETFVVKASALRADQAGYGRTYEFPLTPPKVGANLAGAWSDMTDEEDAFFKRLHEENNRLLSERFSNLFTEFFDE